MDLFYDLIVRSTLIDSYFYNYLKNNSYIIQYFSSEDHIVNISNVLAKSIKKEMYLTLVLSVNRTTQTILFSDEYPVFYDKYWLHIKVKFQILVCIVYNIYLLRSIYAKNT